MTVLVDSNVILDIFTEDPSWFPWSAAALSRARDEEPVVINPIVFAEVAVRFERVEDLDEALPVADFERLELPRR